jgi:DNA-binding transcriptional regulator YiaG
MAKKSYMTAEEFRALRESAGMTPRAWAYLLDCGEQSVRNMEGSGPSAKPIGKQMALLAILLAHPLVRALLPTVFQHRENIRKKVGDTP